MNLLNGGTIQAVPTTREGIALARPRTKKVKDAAARAFGERLTQLRKARGLSQIELAEVADVYQSDISDFERGDRWPETRSVVALAKALRVSTDDLLGLTKVKSNGEPFENRRVLRRVKHIVGLPRRDRETLFRVIDSILAKNALGGR